jgi:hypothetical protein
MTEELLSPAKAAEIAECHNDTIRRAIERISRRSARRAKLGHQAPRFTVVDRSRKAEPSPPITATA